MKCGLIARSEDRGLGHVTWDFARHMAPERVLLVDMGPLAGAFPSHPERFPGATVVRFADGALPEPTVRAWLDGLDAVYSAETWYDARLPLWANDAGVATVLHAMPEFYRPDLPPATMTWAPTTWRLATLPAGSPVVPVPCDNSANNIPGNVTPDPLRVLHVAGHRAARDRNGTLALGAALRLATGPLDVRISCQDRRLPSFSSRSRSVRITAELGGYADRRDIYAEADVLVLPRRYGGLSLPVQEAAAAGLALVMTDWAPNPETWPIIGVRSRRSTSFDTPGGSVAVAEPDARHLATVLDSLARSPEIVERQQRLSLAWAEAHSWDALRPLYERRLAEAVERR